MKPQAREFASVLWPAFLVAAVLEIAVFAFLDPATLSTLSGSELGLSDRAVYSVAFLGFWVVASIGGVLTLILHRSAEAVNAGTVSGS